MNVDRFRLLFNLTAIFIVVSVVMTGVTASAGTFKDREGGSHEWSVGTANQLVWEGQPYIPFGVVFEPKTFAGQSDENLAADRAAIESLRQAGVSDVLIKSGDIAISSVPAAAFQAVIDLLESSGITYGIELYDPPYTPLTGYVIEPSKNRIDDADTSGEYTKKLPSTKTSLFVHCDAKTAEIKRVGQAIAVGDVVTAQISLKSEGDYVLLFYPEKVITSSHQDWGLPDVWTDYDTHRDRLLAQLLQVKFGKGLRYFVDPLSRQLAIRGETEALLPNSQAFRTEYAAWLSKKYRSPRELSIAWGFKDHDAASYEEAAKLIPLWRNGRGVPYAYDDSQGKRYAMNVQTSKLWSDFMEFRAQSVQGYMDMMADALKTSSVDVPVVYTAGMLHPIFQAVGKIGYDGLVVPGSSTLNGAVENAGQVYSLSRGASRKMWIIARVRPVGEAFTKKEDVFSAINASRSLGSKGFMMEDARGITPGTDAISWLANYASTSKNDKYFASYMPSAIYFPTDTANAQTRKLNGGVWWIPTLRARSDLYLGSTLSGYALMDANTGLHDIYVWSLKGAQNLHITAAKPIMVFTSSGEETEIKPKKGKIELTVSEEPLIVRGMDPSLFIPYEVVTEVLKEYERLVARLDQKKIPNTEAFRIYLGRAKELFKKDQLGAAMDMAKYNSEQIQSILDSMEAKSVSMADENQQ